MSTRRIANFTRNVDETGKLTLSALSSDINPSAVAVYDSAGSLPDINLVAGKLAIETQTGNVYVSDASTWHILQRAEPTAVPTVISFSLDSNTTFNQYATAIFDRNVATISLNDSNSSIIVTDLQVKARDAFDADVFVLPSIRFTRTAE